MGASKVDLKNVPNVVWVCLTVAFISIVGAFVFLSATGSDGTEFRSFLNTVINLASIVLGGSSAVYAGVAAKNSQTTKEQTNGALDKRIASAVAAQLVAHGNPKNKTEVKDNGGSTL